MANIAVWFGIALILLGVGGYAYSAGQSPTALIPAGFGLALALVGYLGRDPARRKAMMHIAVVIALAGFLGSFRGLRQLGTLLAGDPVERPAAVVAQSIMAFLCLVFVFQSVRSFLEARRARS